MGSTEWVPLVIRPEDLSRKEPLRSTVVQTLGRGSIVGFVDKFGAGMPDITISGHTGWRKLSQYGDGEAEFLRLNDVVARLYPELVQRAINQGRDPSSVKLIFVDTLNSAVWVVEPMVFELKRNRANPLLFRYNIQMAVVDTRAKTPIRDALAVGNIASGMTALDRGISSLEGFASNIEAWANDALRSVTDALSPVGSTVRSYMEMSNRVFSAVDRGVSAVNGTISGAGGLLIGTASDLAQIGSNVMRSITAVSSIPYEMKFEIGRVASAYQEVLCIFKNSLQPQEIYEDYDALFGASNCSSTTGGRQHSALADANVFDQIPQYTSPVSFTDSALSSISMLTRFDPVLHYLSPSDVSRYLGQVVEGFGGITI